MRCPSVLAWIGTHETLSFVFRHALCRVESVVVYFTGSITNHAGLRRPDKARVTLLAVLEGESLCHNRAPCHERLLEKALGKIVAPADADEEYDVDEPSVQIAELELG